MILAVADYVDEKIESPPIELKYAWQSRTYGGLPNAGGLRDQPAGMMLRMTAAYNVWNAHIKYKSAEFDPKWISSNKDMWNIISEVAIIRDNIDKAKEGNK